MPAPTITNFTAAAGIGAKVWLNGTNFTGSTLVAFNGTSATFTVDNATQIVATVPQGATTGTIAVTNPSGTGTSATSFLVNSTRARLEIEVFDKSTGQTVQTANVYVFSDGTGAAGTKPAAPTGTAVTMFTSRTGSGTVANPRVSDVNGLVTVWVADAGPYDVATTDAASTAVFAGTTTKVGFDNRLETIEAIPADPIAAIKVVEPMPTVWLSIDGDDTTALSRRGRFDYPYANLPQIITDYPDGGAQGQLKVRIRPGPQQAWGSPPFTPGQTFPGQAFNLGTSGVALPPHIHIEGPGASAKAGSQDVDNTKSASYGALFYGNVPADGIFKIGGGIGSQGAEVKHIGITNTAADGIGLMVKKDAQHILFENVHVLGCGGDGADMQKAGMDNMIFRQCQFMNNGQGILYSSGASSGGYGVHLYGANSPNIPQFQSCRFAQNALGEVYVQALVSVSGGVGAWFQGCFIGGGGMLIAGARNVNVVDCYFETSSTGQHTTPFILVDSDDGITYTLDNWAKGIHIYNTRFHGSALSQWPGAAQAVTLGTKIIPTTANLNGHQFICTVAGTTAGVEPTWATTLGTTYVDNTVTWKEIGGVSAGNGRAINTNSATHVWVTGGHDVAVYDNHHSLSTTSARPYVRFDATNSQGCYAKVFSGTNDNNVVQASVSDGTQFVQVGNITNRAETWDRDAV